MRNYHFLKTLATRYTVSLLCLVDSEESVLHNLSLLQPFVHKIKYVVRPLASKKRLQQLMHMARFKPYFLESNYSLEMQKMIEGMLGEERYDAVLFESALIACYRLPAGVQRIIDQHNIEYELLRRTFQKEANWVRKWYNWWESRSLMPAELDLCRQADLVLTTSTQDRLLLKTALPQNKIEVVPNGVDIETFQNHQTEATSRQIIFTGAMNYYPNIEAVLSFARRCWPFIKAEMPEATWVVAGREPSPEIRKLGNISGITVTGTVSDVRPYLAASAVAIVPLHIGGGTRLKILEAFAMRKAVVSTSLGCEGLAVAAGKHLLIADRPAAFVQAVLALLKNPEECSTLGNAGRKLVEEEYSWEHCGARLLGALETHIRGREQVC